MRAEHATRREPALPACGRTPLGMRGAVHPTRDRVALRPDGPATRPSVLSVRRRSNGQEHYAAPRRMPDLARVQRAIPRRRSVLPQARQQEANLNDEGNGMPENRVRFLLRLKLRVGKKLATEETVLTASLAGRQVTIRSERQSQPLSEASWLLIGCRGFEGEDDAKGFGEKLRRAVHLAGLCARVGVDAGDLGDDRTVSWVNPEFLRRRGGLDPKTRIGSDVHGLLVLPDDGKTLFPRFGQANLTVRMNAAVFVRAFEEALPESDLSGRDCPSIRRAVRVLNLAEMNADPIAKVVLAVSTIEGLATDPSWTDAQKSMIEGAAAWLEQTDRDGEETRQVVEAIRRTRHTSIRQKIRKLLGSNDLLEDLWEDWDALYNKRSRLFHGGRRDGSEHRGDHLSESELHALGQEALTLCGRIVLSMAKREGIPVPSRAAVTFGVQ